VSRVSDALDDEGAIVGREVSKAPRVTVSGTVIPSPGRLDGGNSMITTLSIEMARGPRWRRQYYRIADTFV
jgi:hypothetical protein